MLELIHLQISGTCNLRCPFCGQWGEKGFFSDSGKQALTKEEWFAFAEGLRKTWGGREEKPSVILWGGEPLCCPFFDEISEYLYEGGFALGLVTNGTLLETHGEVVNRCFRQIYLSVDGPAEEHDRIRGRGVFGKVRRGREILEAPRITVMSVLTRETEEHLAELLEAFAVLRPDEVLLQQLIELTGDERDAYAEWMKEEFGIASEDIDAWVQDSREQEWLSRQQEKVAEQLRGLQSPFPVTFLPHRLHGHEKGSPCRSPWRHAHVTWYGDVTFCTDFYDFSAGNIRENSLCEIIESEPARRFRQGIREGRCVTCRHCSWVHSKTFRL